MWKLKSIEAENLCAFRSLAYTLQQGTGNVKGDLFGDDFGDIFNILDNK